MPSQSNSPHWQWSFMLTLPSNDLMIYETKKRVFLKPMALVSGEHLNYSIISLTIWFCALQASAAFVNTLHSHGLIKKKWKNHAQKLSDFFGPTCAPGALDPDHGVGQFKDSLCSLCPEAGSGAISVVHTSTSSNGATINLLGKYFC